MSPQMHSPPQDVNRVPRASGDEPAEVAQEIKDDMCSPRERG